MTRKPFANGMPLDTPSTPEPPGLSSSLPSTTAGFSPRTPPLVSSADPISTQVVSPSSSVASTDGPWLLPLPVARPNQSTPSFALSDAANEDGLSTDVAGADLSIATDGSFVETTSALAARELKRRYDEMAGVGKRNGVRSPYAITALQQQGKSVFRISHRPAPVAEEVQPVGKPAQSRRRRRSRLSVGGFLPPTLFKTIGGSTPPRQVAGSTTDTTANRRSLRRARSIPKNLNSRINSLSTAAGVRDTVHSTVDPLAVVMGLDDIRAPSSQDELGIGSRGPRPDSFILDLPFGEGVVYTAPPTKRSTQPLMSPPQLREMHSFESVLTARADSETPSTPTATEVIVPETKPSLPVISFTSILSPETNARSPYSPTVFDVLQTYRGVPLANTLSAQSTEPTIKLSVNQSAAPRDDPRFVIWGEIPIDVDDVSMSQSSRTDVSSVSLSGLGRRRSTKSKSPGTETPGLILSSSTSKKIIMAATIERWIAQLTSELNYDELLDFFLTYRNYISAVDLCHLLICRFHWALETPQSTHEEMVRRIVRVRTFIAIRYWLLTFFRVDFYHNRELCVVLTSWLNTLKRDPVLTKYADAMNIVRKLKKVVRECKGAHTRKSFTAAAAPPTKGQPYQFLSGNLDVSLGSNFAASLNRFSLGQDDSDVDLDFESTNDYDPPPPGFYSTTSSRGLYTPTSSATLTDIRNVPRTESLSQVKLNQPLHFTILSHAKPSAAGTTPVPSGPASLPMQHSVISRAFVNTIGRLGRWKRVLHSRSSVPPPLTCSDISAFDLEINATGDLLTVRGGVEQYLRMMNLKPEGALPAHIEGIPSMISPPNHLPSELLPRTEQQPTTPKAESRQLDEQVADDRNDDHTDLPALQEAPEPTASEDGTGSHSLAQESDDVFSGNHDSLSIGSSDVPAQSHRFIPMDIVSLDDYDLSDSDQSHNAPAKGERRLPRRLPLRKEFEFVRRNDSVPSLGIRSYHARSSRASGSVVSMASSVSSSPGAALGHGGIKEWQIALIDSDDEEPGDAEAALRRLEGQIDKDQQKAKERKVDGWLKTVQERLAARESVHSQHSEAHDNHEPDDPPNNPPNDESQSIEVEDSRASSITPHTSVSPSTDPKLPHILPAIGSIAEPRQEKVMPEPETFVPESTTHTTSSTSLSPWPGGNAAAASSRTSLHRRSHSHGQDYTGKPSIGKILRSRHFPSTPTQFTSASMPSMHRSFILMHRSETLAQHFCIIERDLFLGIKFEEVVMQDLKDLPKEVHVIDWALFLKERARAKTESRASGVSPPFAKASDLVATRARFNLLSSFTASEIVMTHPTERAAVVGKFIRIAWKCYRHNNFATLVAIISGLQSAPVNITMRRSWSRVGMFEMRLFEDLKAFTSREGHFKYLREATDALSDSKPMDDNVRSEDASAVSSPNGSTARLKDTETHGGRAACVPFLGVYLSQLSAYAQLPDFVDPTAPTVPVHVDSATGNLSPPSQLEVFSNLAPLPASLSVEPLINVHKQRLIAGVVKSLVAGQHLASNYQFDIDRKLYQKCLRLQSLDAETLSQVSQMYAE